MTRGPPTAAGHARSQGFVLPVVAVAIAVFALSVLTLTSTVGDAATRVHRVQEDAAFARRAATAQARVAFLLATEPLRPAAIAVGGDRAAPIDSPDDPRDRRVVDVRVDGRGYVTEVEGRPLIVRLQDTAGLVNVNAVDPVRIGALLTLSGVDPKEAGAAAASLADAIDGDEARRPTGAERADYIRRGLAAPLNAPLDDVREAHNVLDWDTRVDSQAMQAFAALATASDDSAGLNVNTAPETVLAAMFGIPPGRAAEIARKRDRQIVRTSDDLAALVGGGLQVDGVALVAAPARTLRVAISEEGAGARPRRIVTSLIFAETPETPPIGVGPRETSPDPEQRSSDERLEPLPAGGRRPPR